MVVQLNNPSYAEGRDREGHARPYLKNKLVQSVILRISEMEINLEDCSSRTSKAKASQEPISPKGQAWDYRPVIPDTQFSAYLHKYEDHGLDQPQA
jgi:hypothetical protein